MNEVNKLFTESTQIERIDALQISERSINPVEDLTDRRYKLRSIGTSPKASMYDVSELQRRLDHRENPALVHEITNVYIQTTHWMLRSKGNLINESTYLIHNQHLVRNVNMFDEYESIHLDPSRIWILGSNYAPGNYWHWHSQSLPAIIHCMETVPENSRHLISVLTMKLQKWQIDSLISIGLKTDQILQLPRLETAFSERLLYSDLLSYKHLFALNRMRIHSRDLMRNHASIDLRRQDSDSPKRIYISRGDTTRRNLINETELVASLEKFDFVSISNSELSLFEQIRLYGNADIVVGPHGAGSTNVMHMHENTQFIEFQQHSHVNAGPVSLGKISNVIPYVETFDDDGLGQATTGWKVDIARAVDCVKLAIDTAE